MSALCSARTTAKRCFTDERTKALFAGIGRPFFSELGPAHEFSRCHVLGAAAHAVGWPIPRHGAQSITDALCEHLSKFGVMTKTSTPSRLCNTFALCGHLLRRDAAAVVADGRAAIHTNFKRLLANFRYGPGVFKVDYALSSPIPWKAAECLRAATVHLGGSFDEIAASEATMSRGQHADRPFVLLAQPSLFDSTRAPAGKHVAWAYCHVPNGSDFDMLPRLEAQIERFAPGFRDCVLARHVSPPRTGEMNANLVGGDINGGALDWRQFLFRPTWRHYATSANDIYICSSSTPPGGGVHGMCGYHAAQMALSRLSAN